MKNNLVSFLNNGCVVRINDAHDFKMFKDKMERIGLLHELVRKPKENNIAYWREIAWINASHLGVYDGGALYFEYQNGKGFTFSWGDTKSIIDWFGPDSIILARNL